MNTTSMSTRLSALIAAGLLLMGCSVRGLNANAIVGSGKSATESRTVSGVTAVTLAASGQVIVEVGESEALTITADDNILPVLTSDVSGGRLTLGTKPFTSITPRTGIVYRLTVKSLNDVTLSGSGSINATGVNGDRFSASILGSGNVIVDGNANSQDVTLNGSGIYDGAKLSSKTAKVSLPGSGNVTVQTADELTVNLSGSGHVYYSGNPARVTKNISGSGTVTQR